MDTKRAVKSQQDLISFSPNLDKPGTMEGIFEDQLSNCSDSEESEGPQNEMGWY